MDDITCSTCGVTHDENDVFAYDEIDFSDVPLLFPQVIIELPCGHEIIIEDPDERDAGYAEWHANELRQRQVIEKEKWFNDQGV